MAGRGPAPKDPERRARANKDGAEAAGWQELTVDEELRGPELPDVFSDGETWHPQTIEWWNTWRRSPQAQTFTETDWRFLIDTALMHHTMWSKARWEFAAELRLRAGKFGATPEDRLRLRLKVTEPGANEPDKPEAKPSSARARYGNLRAISGGNDAVAGA